MPEEESRFGNFKQPEFTKVNDYTWDIPTSFKAGMRVPARIFVSEALLKAMDLQVYDQITNVATLPGIINHAFCMPDGHSGYGFPIGGVAAMDLEEGVISPGGIGFDINCISGDSKILTEFGYFKRIAEFETDFAKASLSCMNLSEKSKAVASPVLFLKKAVRKAYKIRTLAGNEIVATADHPILTSEGMKPVENIAISQKIVAHPFEGVEYDEPSDEILVSEEDVRKIVGDRNKIVISLKKRGLLPLRLSSGKMPILARLAGFLTGDGWIGETSGKWSARAIGTKEDLEAISKDVERLGFKAQTIHSKEYVSKITTPRGERLISGVSTQLPIMAQGFAVLMKALGVPSGNKSRTTFEVPMWVRKAPLWIKRLYLAGLFGAELTKPIMRKGELYRFTEPNFSLNKIESLVQSGYVFLEQLIQLLGEFEVTVNKIYRQEGVTNVRGEKTVKLALRISSKTQNLISLWSRVGYEYNKKRSAMAALAVQYLRVKSQFIQNRAAKIVKIQSSAHVEKLRITTGFPDFLSFAEKYDNKGSPFVFDEVASKEEIELNDWVYDFTMNHKDHNFIANGLVVSNCGMRLVTTNLTEKEVRPKLKEIVDLLFKTVPAGVGSSGIIKSTPAQFRDISTDGAKWCIEQGYGWKEDLERTEEDGAIKGADPAKISDRAIKRGLTQVGTLGSGNHYLEIQVAREENVVDKKVAQVFGITEPDQVVVMFHCGSRGFGHQVASDYLQTFLGVMESKYGIKILDRELACAPFSSNEGQDYFAAMKCAINMSFANRQVILHRIREAFEKVFRKDSEDMEMHQVYDVAHNTAKIEEHHVNGKRRKVLVHRKGATRAFGPGREEVPAIYRSVGQPVIIGGSMETGSYLLAGTKKGMDIAFGTTAHGSGRTMSRTRAKKMFRGDKLQKEMEQRGIYVKSVSFSGLAEEAGPAYKDIDEVIEATHQAGLSAKVAKFVPIGNVKG
jgi:tRNA-splicing ligase RtcB